MYITLQQLSEKPGVVELAQVTAQVGQPLPTGVLSAKSLMAKMLRVNNLRQLKKRSSQSPVSTK